MKKEATLSYAILYIFIFMVVVLVFIVGTPFLLQINDSLSDSGINTLNTGLGYANKIENVTVKNAMINIFNNNIDSIDTHKVTVDFWVQYAWIFVLVIISFVVIVSARKAEVMIERRGVI